MAVIGDPSRKVLFLPGRLLLTAIAATAKHLATVVAGEAG